MKKVIKKLIAKIPTKLPQGVTAFNAWSEEIIDLYDMPRNDSMKWTLAAMILQLKPHYGKYPKAFFGQCLQNAAAKEIAGDFMQRLQNAKKERLAKEAVDKVVPNEPQK